ncbi:protein sprouty homolog 2 [Brachyhypopomus gauderio]|uniref:protein sprouty homolog 2 n=1 Tax=Brachyhypopomus gauderio TaxID=698409 RepID=UPI0040422FBD
METRAQSGRGEVLPPGGHGVSNDEGSETQTPVVLSLHQICAAHISNEYTQGPALSEQPRNHPAGQDRALASGTDGMVYTSPRSTISRSTSGTSDTSLTTARISTDSASSDQRLLGNVGRTGERPVVRAQPKCSEVQREELKPPREGIGAGGKHANRCGRCGRCRCRECTEPRPLPSCWLCGRRCVCSPEAAVDHATCVCCLKALFYHCSSDDEDVCADKPFSCHQPHCCVRWAAVGTLSLLLPCLLCYLPARGCLALCQACHDRAHRPGCRCHGIHLTRCKSINV